MFETKIAQFMFFPFTILFFLNSCIKDKADGPIAINAFISNNTAFIIRPPVQFTNQSTNNLPKWLQDFGDSNKENWQNLH